MWQKHRLDILFVLGILIVGSLALFFKIGEIPPTYPWSDESEIAADAVATLKSGPRLFYPDQLAGGSLAVWLEAGWLALFGKSLLGLRLFNGLVNLMAAVWLYLLVVQLPFNFPRPHLQRLTAFNAALLFAVSTWLLGLGRIATPNWSLVPLMATLIFYLFWLGLNTNRRRYLVIAGVVMGLLFYGYIPGYFAPLVLVLSLLLIWVIDRFYGMDHPQHSYSLLPTAYAVEHKAFALPFIIALLTAAPILIYFALNPEATLQRPLQLADTNELSATGSMAQGVVDMLSTFGLFPDWFWQGNFQHLAFDPLVTVLFVAGLLMALWRWREPAYLFLLVWWGVMITPALLSRSASQGFIFEVWRRGIGAQPVSFIFPALAIIHLGIAVEKIAGRREKRSDGQSQTFQSSRLPIFYGSIIVVSVIVSATLGYWLYFNQWVNSGVIPALFAEAPVRMVEWMAAEDQDTLFIFPLRPNVSPTTRPELFTVRYLFDGPAMATFPVMDETTVGPALAQMLAAQPAVVKLMQHSRIAVDPKGYFEYALGTQGEVVGREEIPDYVVTTYRMRPELSLDTSLESTDVSFGQALRLTDRQIQPGSITAGQTLGVALRWLKPGAENVDYNVSLTLYDRQGYEWAKVDQPLLSAPDYLTTRHWSPGTESTLYYVLSMPADVPPGLYRLRVVAYNAETGALLPPVDGEVDLSFSLAEIKVLPRATPDDPARLAIAQPLAVRFPNGLALVGANPIVSVNHPGDQLWVSLWWQTDELLGQNIGLVLALAVLDGEPVRLFETPQPLIMDYPTMTWQIGHVYRANYRVLLPATLETNDYVLALRLFDLETLDPLAEQLLYPVSVEARPHVFDAPVLAQPLNVDFGEVIRLLGFEWAELSGPEVRLKLQWQALREMSDSYKIFLHLTNAGGQIVGQLDTLPQQGAAPTTSWLSGEIIEDELTLTVPSELSGPYQLVVGLYNKKTGQRLRAGQKDYVVLFEGSTPED